MNNWLEPGLKRKLKLNFKHGQYLHTNRSTCLTVQNRHRLIFPQGCSIKKSLGGVDPPPQMEPPPAKKLKFDLTPPPSPQIHKMSLTFHSQIFPNKFFPLAPAWFYVKGGGGSSPPEDFLMEQPSASYEPVPRGYWLQKKIVI